MKKFMIAALSASLIISMTACFPKGEIDNSDSIKEYVTKASDESSSGSLENESDADDKELKNVTLNLEYPDSPDFCANYSADFLSWDGNKLQEIFLGEKGDIQVETYESDYNSSETYYVCSIEDEYSLLYERGRLEYSNRTNKNRDEYTMLLSSYPYYDMNEIFGSEELNDFSSDKAKHYVDEITQQIGIDSYGEPNIIPLHADAVNELFKVNYGEMEKKDGTKYNVNWTEEDEAYMLFYSEDFEDFQVSTSSAYISAIVTKDGVQEFSVYHWNDTTTVKKTPVDISCSSVDAANVVINHFESLILDSKVELYNCSLSLLAPISDTGEYTLDYQPVWEFDTKQDLGDGYESTDKVYVSAIDGKIIEENG